MVICTYTMARTELDLVNPPEFVTARPLLQSVIDLHNEAYKVWARLAGHVGQASLMRLSRGLAKMKLDETGIPAQGEE